MKKIKYHFNPSNLRYEKIEMTWGRILLKAFGFLSATAVAAAFIVFLTFQFIDSPKEKQLKRSNAQMEINYEQLNERIAFLEDVLTGLQTRDEDIYRTIFEADPIPESIREAGFGGGNRYRLLENMNNSDLVIETTKRVDQFSKQLYIQSKSYDEIIDLLKNKEDMLASIPAIQPIHNKELKRLASGFGHRIHPIYKTRKMHWGLDFSAPTNTPIYATGKGKVVEVSYSKRGYGHHVIIDHGFGYKTLYAHMNTIDVKKGQWVNRADVIGTVGNTGTSTAPHLHYEVFKNGKKINPINFFYNDLSPDEYDKIVEIASSSNQSFD